MKFTVSRHFLSVYGLLLCFLLLREFLSSPRPDPELVLPLIEAARLVVPDSGSNRERWRFLLNHGTAVKASSPEVSRFLVNFSDKNTG